MSTITATVLEPLSMVRLDVDFSDINAPYVRVTRVNEVTGVSTVVRTHGASRTGSDGLEYQSLSVGYKTVMYDTELPLDVPVHYVATAIPSIMNVNPYFTNFIDPWTGANGATVSRVTKINSVLPLSTPSMRWVGDGSTANPQVNGDRISVTVGAQFTLAATFLINSSPATVLVGVQWLTSALANISTSTTSGLVSNFNPLTLTLNVTAPATAAYAYVFVQAVGTPPKSIFYFVDNVTLTSKAGTATSAGGLVVRSEGTCWLKDPYLPGNTVKVDFCFDPNPLCTPQEGIFFASMDAEGYAANSGTFNVNNQPEPVTVSRVRQSRASTLTLVTRTLADRDRLITMLAGGYPLLWQVPSEYGIPDAYIQVGSYQVVRVHPDIRFPIRVFPLPFVAERSPGGPMAGVVGARWQDSCNRYATWGAATAASVTWTQAMQGALG